MTSCTGSVCGGFGGFEKSQCWVLASEEDGWLSELAKALRWVPLVKGVGAEWKVSIERLCLSLPYVEKPFNSKVIKSFVPELRSRKCFCFFCVSGFLCYLYMCFMDIMNVLSTDINMSISRIHIWLCNSSKTHRKTMGFYLPQSVFRKHIPDWMRSTIKVWYCHLHKQGFEMVENFRY